MRRLWIKLRLPAAIVCLLILTLSLARLFSGPEDTWIKNEKGEWVKHGHPSGSPPAVDYQEPKSHLVLPIIFLTSFAIPLFFIRLHKLQNRLTYENSKRDVIILGYLSTALPLLGILIMIGLAVEIGSAAPDTSIPAQDILFNTFFIFSLAGFSGLCILLGAVCYILKRNCSDHYQMERSCRELIEIINNHFNNLTAL